jgi:hypothetical protein
MSNIYLVILSYNGKIQQCKTSIMLLIVNSNFNTWQIIWFEILKFI